MILPNHPYRPLIEKACLENAPVPPDIFEAMVFTESEFNPNARSASDARGLTQIIPKWHAAGAGTKTAVKMGVPLTDALWFDPEFSLRCGAAILRWCYISDGEQSWERAIRAYHSGSADPPDDFEDGQGTTSDQHIARYRECLKAVLEARKGTPVALRPYTVQGLSKPLMLPDDVNVQIKYIGHARFRSFTKSYNQAKTTWHDTGPTGGNADGEYNWAAAGRQGAGVGGYNAIIDDDQIIICLPFDEVVWHAGTTAGNAGSYGAEQCREGVDRNRAIRNAAAFHGAVCAAKGWNVDTALVQHNVWYGKDCPSYIRHNGLWSNAVKQTSEFAAASRAAMGGQPGPTPTPSFEKPAVIPELDAVSMADGLAPASVMASGTRWYWVGDRVEAIRATARRQRAAVDAPLVGGPIKAGEQFDVDWLAEYNGALWYYTPYGTRILASDTKRVSDIKGVQDAPGG